MFATYLYAAANYRYAGRMEGMNSGAYLYILRCADGSYDVGTTRKSREERLAEHNAGLLGGYTASRRPVTIVYAEQFETIADAVSAERQVKGWSRAKKEAMIRGEWDRLPELAKRRKRSRRQQGHR